MILDEADPHLLCELRRMSQTSRFTRARQLTSTVLPGRRLDGYADHVTGRLRRGPRHGNALVLRTQRQIYLLQGR